MTFDTAKRPTTPREKLPAAIRPLLPTRGIYAAGGGLTSSSWRIIVDIDKGELVVGENPKVNSKSFGPMPRDHRVTLPRALVMELVGLADAAWRHRRALPPHPIADYDELLVLVDGDDAFKAQGYGPMGKGPHKALLDRLHQLSPTRATPHRVALFDVQGLFGGRNLFIDEHGKATAVIVAPGMTEARHAIQLEKSELAELRALLRRHGFFAIGIKKRPGVPDEAHPTIAVALPGGPTRSVGKWANDTHPDFDPIYGWLMALQKRVQKVPPSRKGRYDPHWRPRGF